MMFYTGEIFPVDNIGGQAVSPACGQVIAPTSEAGCWAVRKVPRQSRISPAVARWLRPGSAPGSGPRSGDKPVASSRCQQLQPLVGDSTIRF